MKLSQDQQEIWDEYQPRLTEINNRRHDAKSNGEMCKMWTDLTKERNNKIKALKQN